jgi:serine phosphatase RsbU (regulator of sigma subunit)
MKADQPLLTLRVQSLYFCLALTVIAALYIVYGVNMAAWGNSPDFGWRTMIDSGPNVVAQVFASAQTAGLREGDRIQAINGVPYDTFEELYFQRRNTEPGSVNTYSVVRGDTTVDIRVITGVLDMQAVLKRSGPPFVVGLIYVIIGVLVFLMKPFTKESWIFFLMTSLIGVWVSFAAPSDLIHPSWFYRIREAATVMAPASLIHLTLRFPKARAVSPGQRWLWILPYLSSLAFFLLYQVTKDSFWEKSPWLDSIFSLYLLSAVLFSLLILLWNLFRDTSLIVRLQSRVIFIGLLIGFLVPAGEVTLRGLWHLNLFANPTIGYAAVLIVFPLSIGYTIVKHDLFAIDVIIRRTYGYILSTGTVVGLYVGIVAIMNLGFQASEFTRSPTFSMLFALGVVIFFEPLHLHIQRIVDRIFYRQLYDYRKTIKDTSEALTGILDENQIQRTLVGTIVREMFLENGMLLIYEPARQTYQVRHAEMDKAQGAELFLPADNILVQHLRTEHAAILRSDVELNPRYEEDRAGLIATFDQCSAQVMVPLSYKDELQGIIALGGKKSGKLVTPEDIDLLKTIANQGAIALQNARLFEDNLRKNRMEEELKIARDIQMSMLPARPPEVTGFSIAARSIPAREVGGDFYDFIELDKDEHTRIVIVVGDVSGKAVSGALVMAASRSVLRVLSETHGSVEAVMNFGNARLCSDVKEGMFVALVYAIADSRSLTLTLSNAGQTQPILCPSQDLPPSYIETEGDCFPLGIIRDCQYLETQVVLQPGDTVVFYTDGVVEAVNEQGELYGFDRLLAVVEEARTLDANALLDKILHDVDMHVGAAEQHDDITIVILKVG